MLICETVAVSAASWRDYIVFTPQLLPFVKSYLRKSSIYHIKLLCVIYLDRQQLINLDKFEIS